MATCCFCSGQGGEGVSGPAAGDSGTHGAGLEVGLLSGDASADSAAPLWGVRGHGFAVNADGAPGLDLTGQGLCS